jgi:adenylate cyclase
VAGECGDTKLSIVYLGDTLNAAARLEELAKAMNWACLISGDLLRRLQLPAGLAADPLGPVALRGRQRTRIPMPSSRPPLSWTTGARARPAAPGC